MISAVNLREIAHALRRLQRSSPTGPEGLTDWYADGRRFVEWQHSNFPGVRLPPQVMFYLHDADIRMKDSNCRETQNEALDEVISCLERGIVPESRAGAISLHPGWLGAIALVVLAVIFYWLVR